MSGGSSPYVHWDPPSEGTAPLPPPPPPPPAGPPPVYAAAAPAVPAAAAAAGGDAAAAAGAAPGPRYVPPPDAAAVAREHFGCADAREAARAVARMGQRELQAKFAAIFGLPTHSNNNEWLRRKLCEAIGAAPAKPPGRGRRPKAPPGAAGAAPRPRAPATKLATSTGGSAGRGAAPTEPDAGFGPPEQRRSARTPRATPKMRSLAAHLLGARADDSGQPATPFSTSPSGMLAFGFPHAASGGGTTSSGSEVEQPGGRAAPAAGSSGSGGAAAGTPGAWSPAVAELQQPSPQAALPPLQQLPVPLRLSAEGMQLLRQLQMQTAAPPAAAPQPALPLGFVSWQPAGRGLSPPGARLAPAAGSQQSLKGWPQARAGGGMSRPSSDLLGLLGDVREDCWASSGDDSWGAPAAAPAARLSPGGGKSPVDDVMLLQADLSAFDTTPI